MSHARKMLPELMGIIALIFCEKSRGLVRLRPLPCLRYLTFPIVFVVAGISTTLLPIRFLFDCIRQRYFVNVYTYIYPKP